VYEQESIMRRTTIGTIAIMLVLGISGFGQNIPPGALAANKPVFMAGKQVATTGAAGDLSLAVDASKNYVVLHQECSRYEIVADGSEEQKRCEREQQDAARTKDGCRRCEIAGWLIGGKWKPANASTAASAPAGASGFGSGEFRISFFGQAGGSYGGPGIGDETVGTIDGRFDAANYNQSQVDVKDKGGAANFAGGANLHWGSPVGARVGLAFDTTRKVPTQTVNGQRDLGGLQFEQQGTASSWAVSLLAGPTIRIPGGVLVTGGPSFTWWNVDTTQTGQLRAGCPNPCQLVRTDNTSQTSDGSDIGYFLGAEYYPKDSLIGLYFAFRSTTYEDAYIPTDPLGYPPNWNVDAWSVGVTFRTK
jgi:hypothetical protein